MHEVKCSMGKVCCLLTQSFCSSTSKQFLLRDLLVLFFVSFIAGIPGPVGVAPIRFFDQKNTVDRNEMKPLLVLAPAAVLLIAAPAASWSLADRFAGRVVFPRPRRRVAGWVTSVASSSSSSLSPSSSSSSNANSQQRSAMSTKQHHQEIVNFLDRPVESTVGDNNPPSADQLEGSSTAAAAGAGLEDVQDLVRTIVRAADARKAEQIVALQVHKVTTLTSYLVILSGNSRPQNSAIAAAITRDVLEQFGARPGGNGVPEGSAESGWMVLDYGSVMVHIMTPKSRLFYNVEGQWRQKGGVEMDVSDCIVPNTAAAPPASGGEEEAGGWDTASRVEPSQEDDPFWS